MNSRFVIKAVVGLICLLPLGSDAQIDTATLQRVLMVQSAKERGTIFTIDVDGREYWITAKHILTGAKRPPYGTIDVKTVDLQVLNPKGPTQEFVSVHFSVLDTGKDIDIVVLAADSTVLDDTSAAPVISSSAGMTFGGDCYFTGYALGGGWLANMVDGGRLASVHKALHRIWL